MPSRIDLGTAPDYILELSNEEIVEEFLAILEASGASPETIKAYRAALMDFIDYLGDKPLRMVRLKDIVGWRNHRLKTGFRRPRTRDRNAWQVTMHYYNLYVRRFLKWLGIRIYIPNVRKPPRRIEALTDQEVSRLYSAIKDPLDKLILDLLLDTGLRSRELINLRVEDIDFDNSIIVVREAKYGKERRVVVTSKTLQELRAWIILRSLSSKDRVIPLTYSGLYKRLKRLGRRAGIDPRKIRPHVLRHTFATRALRKGMNIISLQRLLGHSDIKTTQVYTHLTIEDIRNEYKALMENTRRCPKCLREVPPDAVFCPYCGASLSHGNKELPVGTST